MVDDPIESMTCRRRFDSLIEGCCTGRVPNAIPEPEDGPGAGIGAGMGPAEYLH
jgi:hypothetical protein